MLRGNGAGEAELGQGPVKRKLLRGLPRQKLPELLYAVARLATGEVSVATKHMRMEPNSVFVGLRRGERVNSSIGLAAVYLQLRLNARDDYVFDQGVKGTVCPPEKGADLYPTTPASGPQAVPQCYRTRTTRRPHRGQ